MQLSVELTLYPLQDNYLPAIKACIEKINSFDGLDVTTFPTATIVIGDYTRVMAMLTELIAWSYEKHGKCVFISKFFPGYEAK